MTQHDRAWHEARLEGFGGTDAAPLLGLSRWRTARDVVEEKIRRVVPDLDQPERLRFRLGKELEPILLRHCQELAIERGIVGAPYPARRASKAVRMKGYPFIFAHPDGYIGKDSALVELKTDAFGYEAWGEDDEQDPLKAAPPFYYVQVQHELAASGRRRALLFVLIGLHDRRLYEIPRDDDFIADLVEVESEAWKAVQEGRKRLDADPDASLDDLLPALDGSAASTAWLKKRYPRADDEVILPATAEQEQLIAELRNAVQATKSAELHEEALKNRLKEVIGEHAGISSSQGAITWRKNADSEVVAWDLVAKAYRMMLKDYVDDDDELDAVRTIHSATKEGARVLRTPRSWAKAEE
jgi:predicted phage-related endonuclease